MLRVLMAASWRSARRSASAGGAARHGARGGHHRRRRDLRVGGVLRARGRSASPAGTRRTRAAAPSPRRGARARPPRTTTRARAGCSRRCQVMDAVAGNRAALPRLPLGCAWDTGTATTRELDPERVRERGREELRVRRRRLLPRPERHGIRLLTPLRSRWRYAAPPRRLRALAGSRRLDLRAALRLGAGRHLRHREWSERRPGAERGNARARRARARGERRPAEARSNHRTNGEKVPGKAIPATSLAKKRKISPVERLEPSIEGFQRNPRTTRREIFSRARSKIKKARWIRFEREGGDSSDR